MKFPRDGGTGQRRGNNDGTDDTTDNNLDAE